MHSATLGLLTQSPCSDIPSGVEVGMVFVTTYFAKEGCLGMSIIFFTMSTLGTSLAGVFRIHRDHGNASTSCFVFNECAELEERPPRHFSTLRLAKPFLALAYAFQAFSTVSPENVSPSSVTARFVVPRSTPIKSVVGIGVPSGTSTETSKNHLPSLRSTRSACPLA